MGRRFRDQTANQRLRFLLLRARRERPRNRTREDSEQLASLHPSLAVVRCYLIDHLFRPRLAR
jgi:hypothetical protein